MNPSKAFSTLIFIAGVLITPSISFSQHQHGMPDSKPQTEMGGALLSGVLAGREGSGTSWLPDSSLMPAFHLSAGAWRIMIHGSIFPRYTNQDAGQAGQRGGSKLDAPSMAMFAAGRPVGKSGRILLRTMLSLDPLVEGGSGYPLLFQSGESWRGQGLVDRQHPHDLFGELAMAYSHALGEAAEAFVYLGYPGEPALGPSTFLHRPSAANNPDAPLGHHWQDSTHIAFGVITAGIRKGDIKVDGSIFTGREPDEDRYGFDRPRLDSWSGRVSWNPTGNWALQISHGFLKNPEAVATDIDVRKTTASAGTNWALSDGRNWASTLVWGWNRDSTMRSTHSLLLESSFDGKNQAIYARAEAVQKTGHDLGLESLENEAFWINALTVGTSRRLSLIDGLGLFLGGQITVSAVPRSLHPEYGRFPVSMCVYLKISPPRMSHSLGHMVP